MLVIFFISTVEYIVQAGQVTNFKLSAFVNFTNFTIFLLPAVISLYYLLSILSEIICLFIVTYIMPSTKSHQEKGSVDGAILLLDNWVH